MSKIWALAFAAGALTCTISTWSVMAAGSGTPLAIKPGLWEMTAINHTSGAPQIPPQVLAGMTPEQRAQVEAAMKMHEARQNQPHVHKICLTEEQLKKGFTLGKAEEEKKCTRKVVNSCRRGRGRTSRAPCRRHRALRGRVPDRRHRKGQHDPERRGPAEAEHDHEQRHDR